MQKPLMRIPYTGLLPAPTIFPSSGNTVRGAATAICNFISARPSSYIEHLKQGDHDRTVLLTGAGVSVASGLADYRGENGTYRQNQAYRPIYYHEFTSSHEARKRYWARSFLGWTSLHKARPNPSHLAIGELGKKQYINSVITQNVDSFHGRAHPQLPTIELHGYLRALVCLSCRRELDRRDFQQSLSDLNPPWATFLEELLQTGALDTENPAERRKKGYRTNPDGDADVPGAPYTTFRYPACPHCLQKPPAMPDGTKGRVEVDKDGAWTDASSAGILKPNVIMFGESIPSEIKRAAEQAIDDAGRILIIGSSLATYSAWRLVKKAHDRGMPVGILNLGGARKEEAFFKGVDPGTDGEAGLRISLAAELVLPEVVKMM